MEGLAMTDDIVDAASEVKRPDICDLHFRRHIRALHKLGERALAEFLLEIDANPHDVAGRLERYARLDPEAVRVSGAAHYPPVIFPVSSSDGGDAA
jgi:hypothetical protein